MTFPAILFILICAVGSYLLVLVYCNHREKKDKTRRLAVILGGKPEAGAAFAWHLPQLDLTRLLPAIILQKCHKAGISVTSARCLSILMALGLVFALTYVTLGSLLALTAIMIVLLALVIVIDMTARRRMDRLTAALPGFFDRLRQSLVVGNSISVALERSTASSPPVIVEFLAPVIRRIANGGSVAESVTQLANELDMYELRQFAVAVETNLRFGGSLSIIIANLIENFRRRVTIEREIRSNTAQIRASAQILAALPLMIGLLVFTRSPDYVRFFLDEDIGRKLLLYCIASQISGAFLMRKIVRITY